MEWSAGTSGYSYKEWKGTFYPEDLPQADMLAYYAERLPAVEINNTFYRMPRSHVLEDWRDTVPADFRFIIKASRRITHHARLKDADESIEYLATRLEKLEGKLGCVLFQLPPYLRKGAERLDAFLSAWPSAFPAAVEFRHESWFRRRDRRHLDQAQRCNLCFRRRQARASRGIQHHRLALLSASAVWLRQSRTIGMAQARRGHRRGSRLHLFQARGRRRRSRAGSQVSAAGQVIAASEGAEGSTQNTTPRRDQNRRMTGPAERSAQAIVGAFRDYRIAFNEITRDAKRRFEEGSWDEVQEAASARLASYTKYADRASNGVRRRIHAQPTHGQWVAIKAAYVDCARPLADRELAETFFNSVHRTVTDDADVDPGEMFVFESFDGESAPSDAPAILRTYRPNGDVASMVGSILDAADFRIPWRDQNGDIGNILRSMAEACPEIENADDIELDVLDSVFFRNKGAYIVGRLRYQGRVWPVALPILRNGEGKVYVDTLICDEDELSVVFSFTRAYFMVLTELSSRRWWTSCRNCSPTKSWSELYASIGLAQAWQKRFSTADFLTHLDSVRPINSSSQPASREW